MGKIFEMIWQREALLKRIKKIDVRLEEELKNEIYRDMAKEVDILRMEKELSYIEALKQVEDMYEKAHNHTDQDSDYEHQKSFNEIISDEEDTDNGEI